MITTTVLVHAAVIAAAMLVALALIDMINGRFSHRGARFVFNFAILFGFMIALTYAFSESSAVRDMLTH